MGRKKDYMTLRNTRRVAKLPKEVFNCCALEIAALISKKRQQFNIYRLEILVCQLGTGRPEIRHLVTRNDEEVMLGIYQDIAKEDQERFRELLLSRNLLSPQELDYGIGHLREYIVVRCRREKSGLEVRARYNPPFTFDIKAKDPSSDFPSFEEY
jgi:hypothetical protein